ncbi:MAG: type II toxin-antitoxin system RelE/ParE family toxin [Chloroflexi bacterium]|nr:type II toxin-antitoxin system RelE/ParE family toxin [Chloroflexota bacterium]
MACDLEFLTSAVDDLGKLIKHNPTLAVRLIAEHIPLIAKDPIGVGERKKGDLSHVRAYGFSFRGVPYRIVFEVDDARQSVCIVAIGVHDTAYRRAKDR